MYELSKEEKVATSLLVENYVSRNEIKINNSGIIELKQIMANWVLKDQTLLHPVNTDKFDEILAACVSRLSPKYYSRW